MGQDLTGAELRPPSWCKSFLGPHRLQKLGVRVTGAPESRQRDGVRQLDLTKDFPLSLLDITVKQSILCVPGKHIRFVFPRAHQTNWITVTFIWDGFQERGKMGAFELVDPRFESGPGTLCWYLG